jgi:hypothetical protein
MEKRPFAELGLSQDILKAVDKLGYEEASPIQTAVIPVALQGRDVVGMSATGSGKTAAFAIPAIELIKAQVRKVQCLILCPTRELAVQVAEETGKLLHFKKGLDVVPIYGGQSYDRQFRALAAGVQIVIGTPGRVMDHMERGTLKLDDLKLVVLDEADRMLDMGFRDDIERILTAVPKERQLLFFSATMPKAIQDLIGRYTRDPAWIKIESHAQERAAGRPGLLRGRQALKARGPDAAHRPQRLPLRDHLLQHQGDGGRPRRAASLARLRDGPPPRRPEPDAAQPGHGEVPQQVLRVPRGDGRRGQGSRRRRPRGGLQLRPPERRRGLHPPHRAHGARGQVGTGHHVRLGPRALQAGEHGSLREP